MYERLVANPSGKRSLTRNPRYGIPDSGRWVPSGRCVACKTKGTGDWSTRLWMECNSHPFPTAVTMTCNDDNYVESIEQFSGIFRTVKKRFIKQGLNPRMHVFCEYGGMFGRAHVHAVTFDIDWRQYGYQPLVGRFYTSELLEEKLWGRGYVYLDDASPASMSYIAGHNVGKLGVPRLRADGSRNYFNIPARRPAIGYARALEFASDFKSVNGVVINGGVRRFPAPFKKYYPEVFASIIEHDKQFALNKAAELPDDFYTPNNMENVDRHNFALINSVDAMVAWHGGSHGKREPVAKSAKVQQAKDFRNFRDLAK